MENYGKKEELWKRKKIMEKKKKLWKKRRIMEKKLWKKNYGKNKTFGAAALQHLSALSGREGMEFLECSGNFGNIPWNFWGWNPGIFGNVPLEYWEYSLEFLGLDS